MNKHATTYEPISKPTKERQGSGRTSTKARTVRAWDLPTRLFKWSLVALIATAWISSGFADPDMTVHKAAGYGILVLLIYRLLWGIFGGSTARFSTFVRSPASAWFYLRLLRQGRAKPYLGHNPAGGLMVIGLLLGCSVQVLLGLFSSDGVTAAGPFAGMVGDTVAGWVAEIHAAWFYFVILGLAGLHIAANLYYQFVKRDNIIGAMITGRKDVRPYVDGREAQGGSLAVAGICLLVAAGVVYGAVALFGSSV
ncbi:cytochrome b/b6 domain-containing protein [Labrys monachus]|uniref:Cytochrome b n=1 Tax=Labrys monachus TaxID=217067 RepID=A0ABU0FCQ1_9HYPH|nr:cytochrome b/b6 domain-containing protein [Labrys monachus]MDQ0392102.1 cytochrome b [Labrys monachus]